MKIVGIASRLTHNNHAHKGSCHYNFPITMVIQFAIRSTAIGWIN